MLAMEPEFQGSSRNALREGNQQEAESKAGSRMQIKVYRTGKRHFQFGKGRIFVNPLLKKQQEHLQILSKSTFFSAL